MNLETLLESAGQVLTSAVGWVGIVVKCITDNPLLLVYAVIPAAGLGVGLFKRLISVH